MTTSQFDDIQFIPKKDFIYTSLIGSLNSVEALVSEVFCKDDFKGTIIELREALVSGDSLRGFKVSCFKILKNLIKRVDKGLSVEKSVAKAIVYYRLLFIDESTLSKMLLIGI